MRRILITTAIFILTAIFSTTAAAQRPELAGDWTLMRMVSEGRELPMVNTGKTPTLKFGSDGISGNGSCNSYGGSYTIDGRKFTPGPVRSTKMACAPEVNAQEAAFFTILGKANTYYLFEDVLTIDGEGGAYSLTFTRKPKAPKVEERPFLWIVDKKKVDCRGIVHQMCLQVKKTDAAEWEILRAKIAGFKYQPGRYNLILVKKTAAGGYQLVRVIRRTKLMPHVD